jgi:hypothetical protein
MGGWQGRSRHQARGREGQTRGLDDHDRGLLAIMVSEENMKKGISVPRDEPRTVNGIIPVQKLSRL